MLNDIISNYALSELLEVEGNSLAIADKDGNILWCNKSFKEDSGFAKIKGRSFYALFSLPDDGDRSTLEKKKPLNITLPTLQDLSIYPLVKKNKLDGYFLRIFPTHIKRYLSEQHENVIQRNIEFQKELHDILSLLVKENSLIITTTPNSIGFNLTHVLQSDYLLISPCFIQNKLLAAVILGKKDNKFSHHEMGNIEQLSSLLAFTISSIKVRELNAEIEKKLLQGQRLETIGKLSSGMAHDFNNLLSSIFGSLNLLKKRVPQSENVTRLIDNIENCSIRARDLTTGLLSFGKPTPKRKELIKPNLLLSELSKVINQTFPKELTFESNSEEKINNILGNPTEIYQILLNLCVNAKEAIRGAGKITLSAKNVVVNHKNISNFPC